MDMDPNPDRCISFEEFSRSIHAHSDDASDRSGHIKQVETGSEADPHHSDPDWGTSRPSRRAHSDSTDVSVTDTEDGRNPVSKDRVQLGVFIELLQRSQLFGPTWFSDEKEKIGEGGQFIVYRQRAATLNHESQPVAVKRLKLPGTADEPTNLYDRQAERYLYYAYLEIKTLTNKKLRNHPNIVRLLAWSAESDDWRGYPVFAFELAFSDLFQYLQQGESTSLELKRAFCRDVAAGLNTIHSCDISHGDLKPTNVLLFSDGAGPVAKLSDFGFSKQTSLCPTVVGHGGTHGWLAPEASHGQAFDVFLADVFSYGLLVWSIFFFDGFAPGRLSAGKSQHPIVEQVEAHITTDSKGTELLLNVQDSVISATAFDPVRRPKNLERLPLFQDAPSISSASSGETANEPADDPMFSWEFPVVTRVMDRMIQNQFKGLEHKHVDISNDMLFSIFLMNTTYLAEAASREFSTLALLRACAERGCAPAKSSIMRLYRYYEVQLPLSLRNSMCESLNHAVGTGSIQARIDLQNLDGDAMISSLTRFRRTGGYFQWYADILTLPPPGSQKFMEWTRTEGMPIYNKLHWLSSSGEVTDLSEFLGTGSYDIDSLTAWGETALQIAFMRGDAEVAKELLLAGANAAIVHRWSHVSCMHWLFNFDVEVQPEVLKLSLERGARLDSISMSLPFLHYPFSLPEGTPLHWAVALACRETIHLLLTNGADPLLRNGADPYRYDDQVRYLKEWSSQIEDPFSIPTAPCQGLTPLDIAAMQRDAYIFEWLMENRSGIDINSADEVGFTVVHRLAASPIRRTNTRVPYDWRPFSTRKDQRDLQHILECMKRLGANLQALTMPCPPQRTNYTPLGLAASRCDVDLVAALVHCGVDVNQQNSKGGTAIIDVGCATGANKDQYLACVKILLTNGAEINHQDRHGYTVLRNAIWSQPLHVAEYLIVQGADIAQRRPAGIPSGADESAFARLASYSHQTTSPSHDQSVAEFLRKHLIESCDARADDVVRRGNSAGETLLHRFAGCGMPRCVELFIRYGADVNPVKTSSTIFPKSEARPSITRRYTPLDEASNEWEGIQTKMHKNNAYSPTDFETLAQRYEEVIAFLQAHGAERAKPAIVEGEFHDDRPGQT